MEVIHLVLGKVNPQRMNGVNKVVYELATRQHAAGTRVEVWGITANPVHDYPERSFTTRLFKASRNPFGISAELKQALQGLTSATVVHMHGGFIPVFFRASEVLNQVGVPFVFTPHGSYNVVALQKGNWKKKLYLPLFEKPLLRNATLVHSLGRSEVDGLHRLIADKPAQLIPYGFDAEELKDAYYLHQHQRRLDKPMVIAFCGRIDIHTKGLDVLVEAFAGLLSEGADAVLWLIGDSKQRAELQNSAEALGIERNVIFHGARYGQEKLELLAGADLFVHPSRNEGLPTSVLEAAAIGLPSIVTVATNVGEAIAEYEAGWTIQDTDAAQLLVALRSAYAQWRSGRLNELGEHARRMVAERYNWHHVLQQFEKMYQSCLH